MHHRGDSLAWRGWLLRTSTIPLKRSPCKSETVSKLKNVALPAPHSPSHSTVALGMARSHPYQELCPISQHRYHAPRKDCPSIKVLTIDRGLLFVKGAKRAASGPWSPCTFQGATLSRRWQAGHHIA